MREAPSIIPRRQQWANLPVENFRDAACDAFDQNDRDHLTLALEVKRNNTLLTGLLITLATSSVLLALNLALGTIR